MPDTPTPRPARDWFAKIPPDDRERLAKALRKFYADAVAFDRARDAEPVVDDGLTWARYAIGPNGVLVREA